MKTFKLILILLLFTTSKLSAQNSMIKKNGHFIAQLDFFNNHPFKDTKGRIPHSLPLTTNGLKNTSEVWYEEKGVKVKGLVQSAALQVDWWLLFGEPTEQYEFQWVSSGYYDIVFTDKKGKVLDTRISKDNLAKYPDLLKRFNNLAPTALDFEISWRIGSQTDADREAFKQRYKLLGSIGSSMPHVNTNFKTTVKNSGLLFEPSGIKPFAVPGIGGGKGRDYLGLPANYDETKLSQIFAYWKISTGQVIQNFSATKNDWPIDEMKAIAEKYLAYENGDDGPTPKEQIALADEKNKNVQSYAKNDFWGDAVKEENGTLSEFSENNKRGLRNDKGRIIIPAKYYNIKYSSEIKYNIIALSENSITIFNRRGKELYNIKKQLKTKVDILFSEDGYLSTEEAGGHNLANARIVVYNISNFQKIFEEVGAWSGLNEKGVGKRAGKTGAFFHHQKWENNYRMYYYYEIKDNILELYRKIGYPGKTEAVKHETFLDKY